MSVETSDKPDLTFARPHRDRFLKLLTAGFGLFGVVRGILWIANAWSDPRIDVDVYRSAASAILHGKYLYGADASAHGLPYLYAPFGAALFSPLSWIPVSPMHVIWTAVLMAALGGVVYHSLEYASPGFVKRFGALGFLGVFGVALAMEPIADNFKFGQINLLVGLGVLLDLRRRTGKIPVGVLTGIAGAVKLTPLFFAVYLFLRGRRRDAYVSFGTFGICTLAGFAVSFKSSWDFWTSVAYDSSRVGVAFITNQSINGFLTRVLDGPDNVGPGWKLLFAAVGAAGLWIALRSVKAGDVMKGDVIVGVTALLISPISWSHHWVWVVPALCWLTFSPSRPKFGRQVAVFAVALFVTAPIKWVPAGNNAEYAYNALQMIQGNAYLIGAIAFLLAISGVKRNKRLAAA